MGKDDYQPCGPGTIVRVTAHQVEVLWEDETARRYCRAQLHNLRHEKLISAAAKPRCTPDYGLKRRLRRRLRGTPAAKHDQES